MTSQNPLHLDLDEHVIFEIRQHWIVFVGHAFTIFLGALFPTVFFIVMKMFLPSMFSIAISGNIYALLLFFYSLWLLFLWICFFVYWTEYYLDVWYVTEKRIIAIDQKGTFNREISNLRFDKIQDVSINVHGLIATFLGFGDIKVQTAGEGNRNFFMTNVGHPDEVRKVIFSQHNIVLQNKRNGSL